MHKYFYEIIAEYPAFQSGDECINENNSLLIGITWDADRDAPPFKAGRVHFLCMRRMMSTMVEHVSENLRDVLQFISCQRMMEYRVEIINPVRTG